MIIYNYSCLVKDVTPSSWREAIQRPLWQEEETSLEVLAMKPGLFVSGSKLCKDSVVYCCAPCCLVDSKRLIEERRWSESTNGNIGALSTLAVWMSEMGSEQSYESQRQITFPTLLFQKFDETTWLQLRYSKRKCTEASIQNETRQTLQRCFFTGAHYRRSSFSVLCAPFFQLFLSMCHFFFSSPPFPVVSMLSILTYLTLLSLHFSGHFPLLF